jgi:tRNA(fMet)-specific endonuclease VapC
VKPSLIAGIAKSRGLVLVTNNVSHFERVPGLIVENWSIAPQGTTLESLQP